MRREAKFGRSEGEEAFTVMIRDGEQNVYIPVAHTFLGLEQVNQEPLL